MKTILFQGDSITDASRPKDGDTNLGRGYAALVAAALGYECPGEFLFYNRGVSGNRITDLYARIKRDVLNLKPDAKIMILEPFVLRGTATNNNWDDFYSEVRKRAEKAEEIAKKYELAFVPLQDQFDAAVQKAPEDHWLVDGVHPTMAGHGLIKREWLKAFHTYGFE